MGTAQLFVFPDTGRNCQLMPITLTHTSIRAEQTTDLIHINTHTHIFLQSVSLSTNTTSKSPIIQALRVVGRETRELCWELHTPKLQNTKPSFYQGQLEACLHKEIIQPLFVQKAFLKATHTACLILGIISSNKI